MSRLERVGERLGLSEALLGVVAALAADAPEITASITALSQHQKSIGAGVVIGSSVFNLAALLGLGAAVAGFIALHRRVVLLGGVVGLWVSVVCLAAVEEVLSPLASLAVALVMVVPYLVILGAVEVAGRATARPSADEALGQRSRGRGIPGTRARDPTDARTSNRCGGGRGCAFGGGRSEHHDGDSGRSPSATTSRSRTP